MALQHEFVFVSKEKGELRSEDFLWRDTNIWYKDGTDIEQCVILSDDFVLYMSDFLQWIPTCTPHHNRNERGFGLNYHGVTKIEQEGADLAVQLFQSLISLFVLAPETIQLTGPFGWIEGEHVETGEYEELSFKRDLLCSQLKSFVTLLKQVKEGKGYILHFGI
ncbi:coproporphyrinogen III oxidase [Bacillus manliponensis]|uniref:Coproporphyrinogen III oxidase n=1 Tax=Bacillus manliponensis TaxID=574376 RepID=A0A073JV05_9BACI|nr:hypothetical protein [Bacillus manliponensis]KEK18874.1 coproporphyrinogen III oxidase [Bacillus manliponensis]